jgi:ATP-dependent Clp protease ATP-binding subunit ClpC
MAFPKLSPAAEKVLAAATEESEKLQHHFLGVEHLFLGLAREAESEFAEAFRRQGVDLPQVTEVLRGNLAIAPHPAIGDQLVVTPRCSSVLQLAGRLAARAGGEQVEPAHLLDAILREGRSVPVRVLHKVGLDLAQLEDALTAEAKPSRSSTPLLSKFGRDLTALARAGALPPLVGREPELDLLAQVLLRKNKNNPVLVGEAGVGKTAVVEGFAQRLLLPSCPEPLRNRRIVELSVGSLVAGTKYRGEFEQRLLDIAEEAARHPEIVLFLDEIHTLVGAGASSGESLDASNIFKPALARGELRCIGATTIEEYRRHIEKDPALERRFEKILVEEPSPDETLEILEGVRPSLEEHHRVTISDAALRAAIDLTVRHVPDRRLPDKALDAIDQSCARKRLQSYRAAGKARGEPAVRSEIDRDDVLRTVSQWTGVPLERLSMEAARQILGLEEELRSRVVGQDHAVHAVARAIQTAKAGLAPANRPLGVFLFLGPTGVGKTQLAKSLAATLFGSERRLVRFDMSEFTEPHSIAKLIGAPPGYVGHEAEGLLVSALRTHPHSVVLFDEIEKAHPQVFDLFLQIFDEGRLTGAHGKSADFTQAVVILTSNVDVEPKRRASMGFGGEAPGEPAAAAADPRDVLLAHFRPELVNRFDQVIVFHRLDRAALRRILDLHVRELEHLLESRELRLELDDAVYDHLLKLGESDLYGARELRRVFDREIRQPLAQEVLVRPEKLGTIRVSLTERGLAFSK